jgi:DNA-binding CsgD family transcriptional regulator
MKPDDQTLNTIHLLWDELADINASQVNEARNHLLQGICDLVAAQNASWVGAVRMGEPKRGDPVAGWRPRLVHYLHTNPCLQQITAEQVEQLEAGSVDASTAHNVSFAGSFRAHRLVDLVPAEWFQSNYYRLWYLNSGIADTIWAGVPINEDAEIYFGIHRYIGQPAYTTADCDIVAYTLRGLRWFHRQQMLGCGLNVATAPLTELERRVLSGLLSGLTEKQIAIELQRSPSTTHEYVTRIFRKYGVNNRASLMALWLGHYANN